MRYGANVLLIEDNAADSAIEMEELKKGRTKPNVHLIEDGEKALQFLFREGDYTAAPIPDLILLDLHLPHRDGLEILEAIRNDQSLSRIPVVIITMECDRLTGDDLT